MPGIDFVASATRHLHDARSLAEAGRGDNAFYLAGYAVECSLKAVVRGSGVEAQMFGHRLVKLDAEGLDLAVAMAPATARYRPAPGAVRAVSDRWSPAYRYAPSEVTVDQARELLEHAEHVWCSCIGEMLLDGVIAELP